MKKRNQDGTVLLLELLCVMVVLLILTCMAVPSWLRAGQIEGQQDALGRVRTFLMVQTQIQICAATVGCTQNPYLTQLVPPSGVTYQQGDFQLTFISNGSNWSYTAVPAGTIFSAPTINKWVRVDQTGIVTCGLGGVNYQPC
jgi:type II secretory pathway pseudopilin PulG